jgi:DNA helicase-2/ATP-dependent DNA helicase PcrA
MPRRSFSFGDGAPAPSPARPGTSTTSVLSFFKDTPVQFDPSAIRAAKTSEAPRAELKRGVRVRHEQFGDGTILTMEGSGPDAKLTVYFERVGSKKFIAKYAKLTRI